MRKIKEVLRLHSLGLSQRQIATSCAVAQATVSDYLKTAEAAGLRWPDIAEWSEDQVIQAVAPSREKPGHRNQSPEPDYGDIRHELQTNKHVTLQLLWEEYREKNPGGYRYSRFCDLYRGWLRRQEVVLRQEHRAAEKLFVDYAGDTIPVYPGVAGDATAAAIFVAVLGASSYTYSEATGTQGLADWIGAHMRAFEFLGGVPEIVVPDNLKSGVVKACRYEPGINRTYEEMAAHYGVAVVPARRRKPRDKAKVEAGVLVVERWILAALRKRKFFSLAEVNQAIQELLVRLNDRPFRKRDGSRRSLFESLDKPALRTLPAERYEYGDWETHRVGIDYHVAFDNHWYSVPYQLTQQEVEVRATAATVEIFHGGLRVSSHARSHGQRSPAQGASAALGVDALPAGGLGQDHRSGDRRTVRSHHGRQAPPGTRLPLLPRHSAALQAVHEPASGGGRAPRHRARCLFLPERQIDSAAPSGQPGDRAGGRTKAAAGPPQHSRLGILRHR
jgi:transposase